MYHIEVYRGRSASRIPNFVPSKLKQASSSQLKSFSYEPLAFNRNMVFARRVAMLEASLNRDYCKWQLKHLDIGFVRLLVGAQGNDSLGGAGSRITGLSHFRPNH
jgi:hypothetical protein